MKIGWHQKPRKERLEHVSWKGDCLTLKQGGAAWIALMTHIQQLSDEEAPPPKFNDLLLAIVQAQVKAKRAS